MVSAITWSVLADFDQDGTPEFDLRPYISGGLGGIRISRGIDARGNPRASQVTIVLNNETGIFTPQYSSSSLYGQVVPDVLVQIGATHSAVSYTRWTGYAQSWKVSGRNGGTCVLTAQDLIGAYLSVSPPINVATASSVGTDTALTSVATALGLAAGDLSFDTGIQTLPLHFVQNQKGIDACNDITRSEMSGIPVWMTADGLLRFESRHARLGTTQDATWGDGTSVTPEDVAYELTTTDVVDNVTTLATIFMAQETDTEVFRFSRGAKTGDSLAIAAGATYTAIWEYDAPIQTLTTPVANTDYTANSAADGSGTDHTSDLAVTVTDYGAAANISLKNTSGATIYVTFFRLRGGASAFAGQSPRFQVIKSAPSLKVSRGVEIVTPFADDSQATIDYSLAVVRTYRYQYPKVTASFAWDSDDIIAAMLATELGQLIKFADLGTGVIGAWVSQADDWWYIAAIEEQAVPDGVGRTAVTLVPSNLFRNLDRLVYDDFTRANASGDLGTSKSGDAWANDGNMDIASNTGRANSDTLQMPNLDLGSSATDQVIEVNLAAIGAGDEVGVVFRYADANNQYRVYLDKGENKLYLEKNVATVVTAISSPAFTVGTAHELRVMVQGTRIRVWVDFVLRIDTTDSALSTGTKVGLFARNASGTATFDDLYSQGL